MNFSAKLRFYFHICKISLGKVTEKVGDSHALLNFRMWFNNEACGSIMKTENPDPSYEEPGFLNYLNHRGFIIPNDNSDLIKPYLPSEP